jgi:transposase
MRGRRGPRPSLFYAIDVEARVRLGHPLRPLTAAVDRIPAGLSDRVDAAYSRVGRPGVPPERRAEALLLMALYSARGERQLAERVGTDLLFRRFLDMTPAEPAFDATAFAHNRPRPEAHGLTAAVSRAALAEALAAGLCGEHFSVDGTLIESHASLKSVRPVDDPGEPDPPPPADGNGFKPPNPDVGFRGGRRTNATPRSATDPGARPYRKSAGQETQPRELGHAPGENRHGLIVGVAVTEANGAAERQAAADPVDAFRARPGGTRRRSGWTRGTTRASCSWPRRPEG